MPSTLHALLVKWRSSPFAWAALAGMVTSGGVSGVTPDGNLVVTLVPGLVVALVVFAVARRVIDKRGSGVRSDN